MKNPMKKYKSNRIRLNHYYYYLSLQLMLLWSPMLLALVVVPSAITTRNGRMFIDPNCNSSNSHEMKRKRHGIRLNGETRLALSKSECTMMGMGFKKSLLVPWNFHKLPHDVTRRHHQQQYGKYSNGIILPSNHCIGNTVTNRVLGFDLQMIPSSTFEEDYHHLHSMSLQYQTNASKTSIFKKRLETTVGNDRSASTTSSSAPIALQVLEEKDDTTQIKRNDNALTVMHTMDTNSNRINNNNNHPSCVPLWFPYIPTRSQIESLKVMELKDACQERGLSKMGKKEELRKRMLQWTNEQHTRRVMVRNALYGNHLDNNSASIRMDPMASSISSQNIITSASSNIGTTPITSSSDGVVPSDTIEPLINRRKALLRSKLFSFSKSKQHRKPIVPQNPEEDDEDDDDDDDEYDESDDSMTLNVASTQDFRSNLQKTFDQKTLESTPNNYQLKTLYLDAKHADQSGNIPLAKRNLYKLLHVTPRDTRVMRRLARLEMEEGNMHIAREIIQSGLRLMPHHADLLHGLAQLELKCGNVDNARLLYKKSLKSNPKFANPYHALATLEHSQGNIRAATTVLRAGLSQCPSNHRLHHALGDLYREAKMLDMADKEYRKGIKCLEAEEESTGKDLSWSKSFLYTGLSYISYEVGNKFECKQWLRKSVEGTNQMHSQGWLGLAQLEESEGNIEAARAVYKEALQFYESKRGLSNHASKPISKSRPKLGDKWRQLYDSWARMEEEYGALSLTNSIYSRGALAFSKDWHILLQWAHFQHRHGEIDRARVLFELACDVSSSNEAKPYVSYAEFEISLGYFKRAQSILFLGAQFLAESSKGSLQNDELAKLYHSWAICEWHLGDFDRTETLFDHALRVTDAGPKGAPMRSHIMYSLARFLHHARKEYSLAQHCVCLALSENSSPGGIVDIWILWSKIANAMGNKDLQRQCLVQADRLDNATNDALPRLSGEMLRRAPWQYRMHRPKNDIESWYKEIVFPQ